MGEMEGKFDPPKNLTCEDGALYILRRSHPADFFNYDDCIPVGPDYDDDPLEWKSDALIFNVPGQKYTIGSGENLDGFDREKHGQLLIFHNKANVDQEQCQIECDASGTFWLRSLGQTSTFLNGKLIRESPVKLKFGDIFYFSHIPSQFWDSLSTNEDMTVNGIKNLYRKNVSWKEYAVLKFESPASLIDWQRKQMARNEDDNSKIGCKQCYESMTRVLKRWQSAYAFLTACLSSFKDPEHNHPIFENHVILTKIFEHVANSSVPCHTRKDLFNFRLVSQTWNNSALPVLQKNCVMNFTIIIDDLIRNPNCITNRFNWKTHRVKELKFDAMDIDIWPQVHTCETRDNSNRNKAMTKFNHDLSDFISQPDFHPLKMLKMNIDYLAPISILLSKFCPSLEEINIQINMLWINDENKSAFPENLKFPKLKKLTFEFCEQKTGDLNKMSGSESLAQVLQAARGIEELVLKNYAELPTDFDSFKNLRKITIYGQPEYNVDTFNLLDFLTQFMTLPADQLRSFRLIVAEIDVQHTPYDALLSFLQNQRQSLETLELSLHSKDCMQIIKLPTCMPNLKRIWISSAIDSGSGRRGSHSSWGFKLRSQMEKEKSEDFTIESDSETYLTPFVVREGRECGRESCPTCGDALVYGEWHGHVSLVPSVQKVFVRLIPWEK
ncbi:uncharacterized protein LOC118434078 isoform X1 [Folsomia candida]|uniref:uncharacterized protein LOC118434078 isoform X1 n=1 Tax=Folsomia candida TaxID=158441 RepID=UPI001604DF05|nr:uncharacterized protein LOC118434078 isoform X1 [Folsomia candida]